MSLIFEICPSLNEANINNYSLSDKKDASNNENGVIDLDDGFENDENYEVDYIDLDDSDKSIENEEENTVATVASRPAELTKYVNLTNEISFLQSKFNLEYEKFVITNGPEAYANKEKVLNLKELKKRFFLIKAEVDITCLMVSQREILYPGRLDKEGLANPKSFVDNKLKEVNLVKEVECLRKQLERCYCKDKNRHERMLDVILNDMIESHKN